MNHSIEELKRQHDAAYSRLTEARRAEFDTRNRYEEARDGATGFVGKLAIGQQHSVLVEKVIFYGKEPGRVEGAIIKKDGTPGQRKGSVYLSQNHRFEDFQP